MGGSYPLVIVLVNDDVRMWFSVIYI